MTSPLKSADFRPDPSRCVYLSEIIDRQSVNRVASDILRLQNESRSPITIYIDSDGGDIRAAGTLEQLLRAGDQDGSPPCRLITVAAGDAASAAADLLMAGNYALAYPHARILCHGVRQRAESLTREEAINLAANLANSNERFAIQLADNCLSRFIFRVAMLISEFPKTRKRFETPLPDTACLIEALRGKVSDRLIAVLYESLGSSSENDALDTFTSEWLRGDFELEQHSSDVSWSLRMQGFERVQEKFDLLLNKYDRHHAEMIAQLRERWGGVFEEKVHTGETPPDKERDVSDVEVTDTLSKFWFFFVAICRALQKDDYRMSAEGAYWLGLIDEVIGRTDLPSPRIFVEYPPANDSYDDQQVTLGL